MKLKLVLFLMRHTISIQTQLSHQNVQHQDHKDAFVKELNRMSNVGVIDRVNKATPWISSFMMIAPGEGKMKQVRKLGQHGIQSNLGMTTKKLHICLDPSTLNTVTQREPYCYETIADILPQLSRSKYFTVIDRNLGYWQVCLND